MTRCMLNIKGLNCKFWVDTISCIENIVNKASIRAVRDVTPYEKLSKRKPIITYLGYLIVFVEHA
jgi:hypothetical protein